MKKKYFYFDGKIELGHILTLCAIVLAFLSLRVSERELETKVIEVEKILYGLQEQELKRMQLEASTLQKDAYGINHTNDLWDYVLSTNSQLRKISDNEFFETSMLFRELTFILNHNIQLSKEQKERLNKLIEFNSLTIQINQLVEKHSEAIKQYDIENSPNKSLLTVEEYNKLMPRYTDNLKCFVDSLNLILNEETEILANRKGEILNAIVE